MGRWSITAASLVAVWANHGLAQAYPSNATTVLAPLVGQLSTPAPGQEGTHGVAPDLGLTDVHEGQLRIIFGDAITLATGVAIGVQQDDLQGFLSLDAFPNGDAVDTYLAEQHAADTRPMWQKPGPAVSYRVDSQGQPAAIRLYDGGPNGLIVDTGLFKAPIAAFSNAKSGAESAFFTIYGTAVPQECSGGPTPSCDYGFECVPGLGKLGSGQLPDGVPCLLGTPYCQELTGGGLCIDPTSSLYDPSSLPGLVQAMVWRHQVGNADPVQHEQYYSRPWFTNKFTNLTARTVNDFDPARPEGSGNDYAPADGSNPNAKVLIWGRPNYIGTKSSGHDLKLYLAFVDVPSYSPTGNFEWAPRYFAGVSATGAPLFTPHQSEAHALDLSGTPAADNETWDVVNQMAISWVAPLKSWVMLYGGGANDAVGDFLSFGQTALVQRDPEGAIHVRFAAQPWGPWSAPQQLFVAGNPLPIDAMPAAGSQYGPGGVLRHPQCLDATCAPHENRNDPNDYGFLYGVNIIDRWTQETSEGANIFWNMSTWHPYQVLLMKTALSRPTHQPVTETVDAGTAPTSPNGGVDAGATVTSMDETKPTVSNAGADAQQSAEATGAVDAGTGSPARDVIGPTHRRAASCATLPGAPSGADGTAAALALGPLALLRVRAAQRSNRLRRSRIPS